MYIQQRYKCITHYKIPLYFNIYYVLLYYYCMSPQNLMGITLFQKRRIYQANNFIRGVVFILILVYCIINFKSLILFPVL